MTDISMNSSIQITRNSCFKIKQIISDLEKKLAIKYNNQDTVSNTSNGNNPAGVVGSVKDNSYYSWVNSLRQ